MSTKSRQISESEVKTLRKLGMGNRIETRFYLLPDSAKTKRRAPAKATHKPVTLKKALRGITKATHKPVKAEDRIALTKKAFTGQRSYNGLTIKKDVYEVAEEVLTTPGNDSIRRNKLESVCMGALPDLSRTQIANGLSHLIAQGYIKRVN